MNLQHLIESQWSDYSTRHRKRNHLLIQIVAVPLFWLASIQVLGALLLMLMGVPHGFRMLLWAAVLIGLSLGAQAVGRSLEYGAAQPAVSPIEFARRTLVEQFVTFPRFLLTGGWLRNLKAADGG